MKKYAGERIVNSGWRVSVDVPPAYGSYVSTRRNGCVWTDDDGFRRYYELEVPGHIMDIEVGAFETLAEAKRTALEQLKIYSPVHARWENWYIHASARAFANSQH